MKALLYKDIFVLWKQMKFFLLLILVFSAIPNSFNNAFAVIYAAMLPYTAMAYDERSKWDQLAAMMPYSIRDLVLSKYLLGWLGIAAATVLSFVLQSVLALASNTSFSAATLFIALCSAVCIISVTLPMMFRFSVEKARLAMFLIIFLICGSAGAVGTITKSIDSPASFQFGPVMALLPAAAVILSMVSIPLSCRFYRRRT